MAIGDEKYVSLTTFKRDGTPVSSPVWIVHAPNGKVGFRTSSTSGKVKRLRHTPTVTLQPSDARGRVKPGSEVVHGTAELLDDAASRHLQDAVKQKYGIMVPITRFLGKIGSIVKRKQQPYGDVGVEITLDG